MHKAFVEPTKCLRCKDCPAAKICSIKAIFQIDSAEPAIVDSSLCHGCGDCVSKCIGKAITLKPSQ